MKRILLLALLAVAGLCSWCPQAGASAQSTLSVMTDRDHLNVGETLEIQVRIWSVLEGRVVPPLGGELTVIVMDALRGSALRSFKAEPDGTAQLFRVAWSPTQAGGYRIVAHYENPQSGERIASEAQVTVGLGLTRGSTQTTAPPTTTTAPYPEATTLPAPAATGALPAPEITVPLDRTGTPTRVAVEIGPGNEPGEYELRISVTTDSGAAVPRGEVLVAVDQGSLSRGGVAQAMVGLDGRGLAVLGWDLSRCQGRSARITVDYLGDWSGGQEFASSSTAREMIAAGPVQVAENTTTAIPQAATTNTLPIPVATAPSPTVATLPPFTAATVPATTFTTPPPPTTTTTTLPPVMQHTIRGRSMTNTVGMVFRLIPAGSFQMGDPGGRNAPRFAAPVHRVEISRPFWMGVYEVTQEEWAKVMGSRPSKFRGDPRLPVERVSPIQVAEFIKRLNAREGTGAYRLPTEAEWEYACRAGTTTPWSFGSRPEQLGQFAWWISNSGLETRPVGLLRPNPWDLFDIHGNVAELCSDWFGQGYYAQSPGRDPRGPEQGTHRVSRGGSWLSGPVRLNCAARVMAETGPSLGFRLVREK